jgi:Heterokaryon incompatibility protein (HET)
MSLPMYETLNEERREIRLLVLEPPRDVDTLAVIECSMKVFSLNENPQYVALSYVWGSSAVTENIIVNGSPFPVTINLARALRQLEDSPLLLWVDAICINQRDVKERNSQVRMMGDIYRNASIVVSWLGPEADKSSEAMIALRSIAQEVRNLSEGDDRISWLERYPELLGDMNVAPTPWEHIAKLWLRDYWTVSSIYRANQLYQHDSLADI